jgi:hypothetical protein
MKYLKKFDSLFESIYAEKLGNKTFSEITLDEYVTCKKELSKTVGPKVLTDSDVREWTELLTQFLNPSKTGMVLDSTKNKMHTSHSRSAELEFTLDTTPYGLECQYKMENGLYNYINFFQFGQGTGAEGLDADYYLIDANLPFFEGENVVMETKYWILDWDGIQDWIQSSPYTDNLDYSMLKFELKTRYWYAPFKTEIIGEKTNSWINLHNNFRIFITNSGCDKYFFDDKGHNFGKILKAGRFSELYHDGTVNYDSIKWQKN